MFEGYILLVLVLALVIAFVVDRILKRKIKKNYIRIIIQCFTGLAVVIIGVLAPFIFIFSAIDNYPEYKIDISEKYYYKQQEFGFVTSMPGTSFEFYEDRWFWFDKKIGHLVWNYDTRGFDIAIDKVDCYESKWRLNFSVNERVSLDRIVDFEEYFYIEHYNTQ